MEQERSSDDEEFIAKGGASSLDEPNNGEELEQLIEEEGKLLEDSTDCEGSDVADKEDDGGEGQWRTQEFSECSRHAVMTTCQRGRRGRVVAAALEAEPTRRN